MWYHLGRLEYLGNDMAIRQHGLCDERGHPDYDPHRSVDEGHGGCPSFTLLSTGVPTELRSSHLWWRVIDSASVDHDDSHQLLEPKS